MTGRHAEPICVCITHIELVLPKYIQALQPESGFKPPKEEDLQPILNSMLNVVCDDCRIAAYARIFEILMESPERLNRYSAELRKLYSVCLGPLYSA